MEYYDSKVDEKYGLTRASVMRSIHYGSKVLNGFILAGAVLILIIIVHYITDYEHARDFLFGYLFFIFLIVSVFIVLPGEERMEMHRKVKAIRDGNFYILKDVIEEKSQEVSWNQVHDRKAVGYYIKGKRYGELPISDEWDWEACKEGEQVYLLFIGERELLLVLPESRYALSNKLTEKIRGRKVVVRKDQALKKKAENQVKAPSPSPEKTEQKSCEECKMQRENRKDG